MSKLVRHRSRPASHYCGGCNKGLGSSESLWHHRRICKTIKDGSGFTFTPASNGEVSTRDRPSVNRPSVSRILEQVGEIEHKPKEAKDWNKFPRKPEMDVGVADDEMVDSDDESHNSFTDIIGTDMVDTDEADSDDSMEEEMNEDDGY